MPVSIDLSAEATSFGPLPLRRLRGAVFLEGERLTLSDVSALLPGETELEVAGATAGSRIELAVHFTGRNLRETLAALGLDLAGTDPARLRVGEGRFRLVLQEGQAEVSDLAAVLDGSRISGAGVLRRGARPAIGLGVTMDRLDLDGLLPPMPDWPALSAQLAGFDLNLRLAVEELAWRGLGAQRATLDATLEAGKLSLRRLALRLGELDAAASGVALLGPPPRFSDLTLELNGTGSPALTALLLPDWMPDWAGGLAGHPIALRLTGGGAPEAVALKAEGDLGELRLEAAATLNAIQQRGSGTLTLRHPGAPRLLAPLLGPEAVEWLGHGSLAVIASLAGTLQGGGTIGAESLDVVAGGLRARGQLSLALGGARPRLSGRIAAERLPLPGPALRGAEPLGLDRLAALDAELALEAARVEPLGGPVLEQATAVLRLADGSLRLDGLLARLGGGTLRGGVALEGSATPPRLALDLTLEDATISGPLLDLPLDLGAGRAAGSVRLAASGHSMAALMATLEGGFSLNVRDGVLIGFDLAGLQAAAGQPALAEAALRQALAGGATAFEVLELAGQVTEGRATLTTARLTTEGGGSATASGAIDLGRGALDLRLAAQPVAEAPEIGLRLTGPATAPQHLPELAPFLRWRAER
ncbi:AsmA-like C-terminal region-containing protein [Siccirubricoccus sp. G192]|uniref:AsmA family protein n=1 Tax=Siccirubricoccus sp. G192 TaxID=2849651 RepID=UPI001C2C480B|nr:AsmA-like C-terminal region-containing protein [Siccirubricoccus sp. G192]MBV1797129.1 AsmA family protein [Siccirubricoccus sp. G192]